MSDARRILFIDTDEARVATFRAAVTPYEVTAANGFQGLKQLEGGNFHTVIVAFPLYSELETQALLAHLKKTENPIPVAIAASVDLLPAVLRAGLEGLPVLSLDASAPRIRDAVSLLCGGTAPKHEGAEKGTPGPAFATVAHATGITQCVLRGPQPEAKGLSVELVLPAETIDRFRAQLKLDWGAHYDAAYLAHEPALAAHPVIEQLNGLKSGQEVTFLPLPGDAQAWVYAALLPWVNGRCFTLLLGVVAKESKPAHLALVEQLRRAAMLQMPWLHIPPVKLVPGQAVMIPEYDWVATEAYVGPDRRRLETAMVSGYALKGRRRMVRQAMFRFQGFMGRADPWFARSLLAYLGLALLNAVLTVALVRTPLVEGLSGLQRSLASAPIAWFLIKNALTQGTFFAVARFEKFKVGAVLLPLLLLAYLLLDVAALSVLLK